MDQYKSSIGGARKLPPLAALRAFEVAARHMSFQKAAHELFVTPTAISHQIRLLESTLGLTLFKRHVRRISLTEAGLHLFPVLREGFDTFERAVATLSARQQRRAVTITATTLFTARRLIPALGAFQTEHPGFELRLHASDDVIDLTDGIADVAVRYGDSAFENLVAESLCKERFGVVCSPSLGIRKHTDLAKATLIHTEWRRVDLQPSWRKWCEKAGISELKTAGGLRFTDDSHAIQAAIAGHGVAIASMFLLEDELARGVLVQPFGPTLEGASYHFLSTVEKMACEDVQAVRSWLKKITLVDDANGSGSS
jgi:LysR family transcriptional regulator, glycine cleavage system transcriptional activator